MTIPFAKFKNTLLAAAGLLLLSNVLLLAQRPSAQADDSGVNLRALAAQVGTLKLQMIQLRAANLVLEDKVGPISSSGTDLFITGVNVHIVSGSGFTNDDHHPTGLGNLTIGYNELNNNPSPRFPDIRTGSHNLIVGQGNSYASYGGLVAGQSNLITTRFATVTGGSGNTADNVGASVSGGSQNTATGVNALVSGGDSNKASGNNATVSGGQFNHAHGFYSSVGGGIGNTAFGSCASVQGGYVNNASGNYAAVSGGSQNVASGDDTSISGGYFNTAGNGNQNSGFPILGGDYASVSGGSGHFQNNKYGWSGGSYHSP